MGFFSKMLSATVKTALSPLAVVKDGVNVLQGKEVDSTSNIIDSIEEDIKDGFDDIS